MPYISSEDREQIVIKDAMGREFINNDVIYSAGELQYAMAKMFKAYLKRNKLSYQTCNDIMGALAGAQMEFYRRTVAPYEDIKIKENGDV